MIIIIIIVIIIIIIILINKIFLTGNPRNNI